jgi:flavin-dependent dehydrogenase
MPEPMATRCCIAGGGPAGVMLGFLLARAGIDVVVLEKHADCFRDFRGDTILTVADMRHVPTPRTHPNARRRINCSAKRNRVDAAWPLP